MSILKPFFLLDNTLMPKTCSNMKFLMFEHPLTPLFQHLGESVTLFLSVKVDQHLNIETLKISKHQRVPSLKIRGFLSLISLEFYILNP